MTMTIRRGRLLVMLALMGCGVPGSSLESDTDGDTDDDDAEASGAATPDPTAGTLPTTGPTTSTSSTTGDTAGEEESGSDGETGEPAPECEGDDAVTCYAGGLGTLNVGVCAAGVQTCADEMWSDCLGEVLPSDEVCNGEDDDCDGDTDEGCECIPGETQACYTGPDGTLGEGLCQAGVQTCVDPGTWGDCDDEVVPAAEDCNGTDDNCDGDVDEGCECTPGDTQPCYSGPAGTQGVGECVSGTQTCSAAAMWGGCLGDVVPVAESCNGDDDDCNGAADDLGLGDACDTGEPGECAGGQEACVAGGLVCEQTVVPVVEVCDDLDNNCNGETDEDLEDDPILLSGELPDAWSTGISLVGSYPPSSAGLVPARLHDADDEDWFSVFAEEQVFDVIGDTPVVGTVSLESPGTGFSYEVCACWSTSTTFCAKSQGGATQVCATSDDGNTAQVQVQMAMVLGPTDQGWLDVVVRTDNPTEVGCDLYEVGWSISED